MLVQFHRRIEEARITTKLATPSVFTWNSSFPVKFQQILHGGGALIVRG